MFVLEGSKIAPEVVDFDDDACGVFGRWDFFANNHVGEIGFQEPDLERLSSGRLIVANFPTDGLPESECLVTAAPFLGVDHTVIPPCLSDVARPKAAEIAEQSTGITAGESVAIIIDNDFRHPACKIVVRELDRYLSGISVKAVPHSSARAGTGFALVCRATKSSLTATDTCSSPAIPPLPALRRAISILTAPLAAVQRSLLSCP